jgi:hypothetical protein
MNPETVALILEDLGKLASKLCVRLSILMRAERKLTDDAQTGNWTSACRQ